MNGFLRTFPCNILHLNTSTGLWHNHFTPAAIVVKNMDILCTVNQANIIKNFGILLVAVLETSFT
jgi:hypothetical protein